jgi:hypothetical protein
MGYNAKISNLLHNRGKDSKTSGKRKAENGKLLIKIKKLGIDSGFCVKNPNRCRFFSNLFLTLLLRKLQFQIFSHYEKTFSFTFDRTICLCRMYEK